QIVDRPPGEPEQHAERQLRLRRRPARIHAEVVQIVRVEIAHAVPVLERQTGVDQPVDVDRFAPQHLSCRGLRLDLLGIIAGNEFDVIRDLFPRRVYGCGLLWHSPSPQCEYPISTVASKHLATTDCALTHSCEFHTFVSASPDATQSSLPYAVPERWTRGGRTLDTACWNVGHADRRHAPGVSTIPAPRVHHSRTSCQPFPHLVSTVPTPHAHHSCRSALLGPAQLQLGHRRLGNGLLANLPDRNSRVPLGPFRPQPQPVAHTDE